MFSSVFPFIEKHKSLLPKLNLLLDVMMEICYNFLSYMKSLGETCCTDTNKEGMKSIWMRGGDEVTWRHFATKSPGVGEHFFSSEGEVFTPGLTLTSL